MYEKNLTEDLRLRLSSDDMEFLRTISAKRNLSVSACIRSIIGEYRRSLDSIDMFSKLLDLAKEGKLSNGDTKTDLNHKLQQ